MTAWLNKTLDFRQEHGMAPVTHLEDPRLVPRSYMPNRVTVPVLIRQPLGNLACQETLINFYLDARTAKAARRHFVHHDNLTHLAGHAVRAAFSSRSCCGDRYFVQSTK